MRVPAKGAKLPLCLNLAVTGTAVPQIASLNVRLMNLAKLIGASGKKLPIAQRTIAQRARMRAAIQQWNSLILCAGRLTPATVLRVP